jgi:hypothetical protein
VPLLVQQVAREFLRHHAPNDEPPLRLRLLVWYKNLAYPADLVSYFRQVFDLITEAVDWPHEASGEENGIGIRAGAHWNVQVDRVAEIVIARQQVFRNFWTAFDTQAEDHIRDLLALHHRALDHSRPIFRFLVALFYASGFVTLLYPTASTFWLIVSRAIR